MPLHRYASVPPCRKGRVSRPLQREAMPLHLHASVPPLP